MHSDYSDNHSYPQPPSINLLLKNPLSHIAVYLIDCDSQN